MMPWGHQEKDQHPAWLADRGHPTASSARDWGATGQWGVALSIPSL